MTSSDLPEGTANDTSLSFNQGVEELTDILGDPETDLNETEGQNVQANSEAEPEDGVEPSDDDADDEALDLEADPDPSDEDDGPGEIKGGQFAPDTAKVTLEDGTVISIAELKRNNLFQRDYSQKTEELKQQRAAVYAEKEAFESEKQSVTAQAQELAQYRDFVLSVYQQTLPQPPDKSLMQTDLIGYWEQKELYEERMAQLQQLQGLRQNEEARRQQEQAAQFQATVQREVGQLMEKLPDLRDKGKMEQFRTEVVDALAPYGFTADEIGTVVDHRMLLVAKDIVRLQKALRKAPQVKQQVQQKPKLISGGKRMDPKARTSRETQAKSEHLRKTGSFDAGVAALMDLDL